MLTVEQALSHVMERSKPLPTRQCRLADALGLLLAEDVDADCDLPPFDKSLVDGYAVNSVDLAHGDGWLKVGEEITAGRTPTRPLAPGEAALIMTGAPLPVGTDAVIMLEAARHRDDGSVSFPDLTITPGRNCLPRGREMRVGDRLLTRGQLLKPVDLGVLASVGRAQVEVVPQAEVLVLPTGDELVEPDQVPGPGQIRNSNATMLAALARPHGSKAEALPIARDECGVLRSALERGLAADVLLITGGVSVGNRDLVPSTLEALGVACVFHKVRVKPGKPLWFGVGPPRSGGPGCLVFGLPGNPVSGLVGFLLFVRPALRALQGSDRVFLDGLHQGPPGCGVCSPRRSSHLSSVSAGLPGNAVAIFCPGSSRFAGPDRLTCEPWPRLTASPSSPPAIATTLRARLCRSC